MSSPIVLNAVWGVIAFAALLLLALAERKHWCVDHQGKRLQRVCAVLLAVCFLFPCVSASDDILGLSTLRHVPGGSSPVDKNLAHLERVLQELETFQLSSPLIFTVALNCVGLVEFSCLPRTARQLPCTAGRGPPAIA